MTIASFAEHVVNTLTQAPIGTPFTPAGHYDCDNNGSCALLLKALPEPHLRLVP